MSKPTKDNDKRDENTRLQDPFAGIEDEEAEMAALEQAERERKLSSSYMDLKKGEPKIVRVLPARGVKVVDKTYKGKPSGKKHQYIAVDLTEDKNNRKEQFFEIGWNSRKLIEPLLREGHRLFSCIKTGEGQDTLVIPTPLD